MPACIRKAKFLNLIISAGAVLFFLQTTSCAPPKPLDLEKDEGFSTIPFYSPGQQGFSTTEAIERTKQAKEAEAKRLSEVKEEIKKRMDTAMEEGNLDDPWVPPESRPAADLPEAIRGLPKDFFGYPDWVKAVERGFINPKGTIFAGEKEEEETRVIGDIIFEINDRIMANVRFPHKAHIFWLSCDNCHPDPFKEKKGATQFQMQDVWNGEYCGRCHGKVAFQPKGFENCQRCHSARKGGPQ